MEILPPAPAAIEEVEFPGGVALADGLRKSIRPFACGRARPCA
jgi:hypothetical protein